MTTSINSADHLSPVTTPEKIVRLTFESWFIDHTLLNKKWVEIVRQQYLDEGSIPIIEHHPQYGWVFHTLYQNGVMYRKDIAAEFDKPLLGETPEKDMEDEVCRYLTNLGIPFDRQLPCSNDIVDIVTDWAVYELRTSLRGSAFYSAIGEVLVAKAELEVSRAFILCNKPEKCQVEIGKRLQITILDYRQAMLEGRLC